jgi:hypothetical protein
LELQETSKQGYLSGVVGKLGARRDRLVRGECIQLLMMGRAEGLSRDDGFVVNIWKEARMAAKPFWGVVVVLRTTGLFGLRRD